MIARFAAHRLMLAAVTACLIQGGMCRADLLVYEGFDYKAPGRLGGNGHGKGFAGEWTEHVDSNLVAVELAPGSLSAPAKVVTTGNQVNIPTESYNNSYFDRLLRVTVDTGSGRTYYFSYLFKLDSLETNTAMFQLQNSANPAAHHLRVNEHFNVGSDGKPAFRLELDDASHSDPTTVESTPLTAQTYFVVGKIVGSESGPAVAYLYVFPASETRIDPSNETASLGAAAYTTTISMDKPEKFDQIYIGRWSSPGLVAWDEIRIGTTFEDVITGK